MVFFIIWAIIWIAGRYLAFHDTPLHRLYQCAAAWLTDPEPCDAKSESLVRKYVNLLPKWVEWTAAIVITVSAGVACHVGLSNILDAVHWTGTLIICVPTLWKLSRLPREAQDTIDSIKNGGYMRAYRMVEEN